MQEGINVRELVLDILVENETHHTYSNILIRRAQDQHESLTQTERSFLKRLAEGTIERRSELDEVINRHLQHPGTRMKPVVRCLLRMSVYQIYYMDSVTDYATVDEAVKILRRRHLNDVTGFVNGVLRSICRDKDAASRGVSMVVQSAEGSQVTVYLRRKTQETPIRTATGLNKTGRSDADMSHTYSMPEEIISLWREDLGAEETQRLLESMLEIRPVTIRMDTRLDEAVRRKTLDSMTAAGIHVQQGRWLKETYYLTHLPRIQEVPGFSEGYWTVQDESSQLTAYAAGLAARKSLAGSEPSDYRNAGVSDTHKDDTAVSEPFRIIDLCAAPGGKSMAAASLAPDAVIQAYDLSRMKTDQIRSNIARMHYENITVSEQDATVYNEDLRESADLVICDVPCSGLGVITKKRDIKYNMTVGKIRSLVSLQKRILRNAASYVRPGGVLLYSTCTIDRAENERQADYIRKELGLVPDDLASFLPEGFPGVHGNMVQMLPHVHGTDGFFIARFLKTAP